MIWINKRLGEVLKPGKRASRSSENIRELSQYQALLLTRATRMTRDLPPRISAEDLVQQTLLEAHQHLDKFQGKSRGEMIKWLDRMLSNNISDTYRSLRRKKRDVSRECSFSNNAESSYRNEGEWFVSNGATPSHYAANTEQAAQLAAEVQNLPSAQRDAIDLHYLQCQSLATVAQRLGRTRGSVAGLVFRGLRALREKLS